MSSTTTIVTQSYLTIRATDKGVGVFYADTNPQEAPAGFGKTLGGSIARFRRRTGPVQPSRDLPSRATPQNQAGAVREPARKEITAPTCGDRRSDGASAMAQARASSGN